MLLSLRARLTSSFMFIALISILLTSVLANLFLESQFRQYIKGNLARQNKQIVEQISREYGNEGWNSARIMDIGMNALAQGLIVKLENPEGAVVWDAMVHNNGLCQQMMRHMAQNMLSRYPNWKGEVVETQYPVMKDFKTIGTVKIGYYGPFYFKDSDLAFINTLNRILMGVTVLALLLASITGSYTAKRISAPIAKVIHTAQEIATGNLGARSTEKTNIKEINQLTEAVNNLAHSLQQQETLRKRLTADVAHELRTPLAALQSHMEAILDGIWKLDLARVKVCYDEVLRVNRMVKEIEKLAKYEGENLLLEKTQFNLGAITRQAVLNFEPEYHQKQVTINVMGGDFPILADRDKISQVLVNLLANSLKFTPAGGRVEVRLTQNENSVVITVRDTGIGIAPEDLPYIFERFYRADKSRDRTTGGAGVGLAIVKAIVEAHGGAVWAESEPGQGTRVFVRLPQ
ncbi:MAG: HAMP domain-containing protein [Firmicutes bacterium]|nr:HAMP domain-containing protein [Bacillota bacterium]